MASTPTYPDWYEGREVDMVSASVAHLRSVLPEASIHPSSTEAVLLESQAVMAGPTTVALQNVHHRLVDHLMGLYGLERSPGRRAEGKARFTVSPGTPIVTIPAGTIMRYYRPDSSGLLEYRTVDALSIVTEESLVGEVQIAATSTGVEHNGLPVGSRLDLTDYYVSVNQVSVSVSPKGGLGPESEESWRTRSTALLSRQVTTLVVPDNFRDAALSRPEIGRAYVLNLHDTAARSKESPGHVTVAVTDAYGDPVTPRERTDLQEWLQDQSLASLVIHVADADYTTVNPVVVVEAEPDAILSVVEDAVDSTLRQWINPATWAWWPDITPYDFVSAIDDVPGVARVITVPQKITLNGFAPLPRLGTVTITVNESTRR